MNIRKTLKLIFGMHILIISIGSLIAYKLNYKMSLKEYRKYALYMAVLDDEICRIELEENIIDSKEIKFPKKMETLTYRYDLFLNMNRKKSKKELQNEIDVLEMRLEESKKYLHQKKAKLENNFI